MKEGEKVDTFLGRTLNVVNKMKSNKESNDLSILTLDELHGSFLMSRKTLRRCFFDSCLSNYKVRHKQNNEKTPYVSVRNSSGKVEAEQ
ncbi:hypothetical protein VNO78_19331 [Psophocarpus tetragonolobus]|uniref:Uncharacterized protein n=1 Tax=Psophocarpus tetragonolobus TaxID=3891 RepID=A0AAN9S8M1_PSOTE